MRVIRTKLNARSDDRDLTAIGLSSSDFRLSEFVASLIFVSCSLPPKPDRVPSGACRARQPCRRLQLLVVLVFDAQRLADVVDDVLIRRRVVAARRFVAAEVRVLESASTSPPVMAGACRVLLQALGDLGASGSRGRSVAVHVERRGVSARSSSSVRRARSSRGAFRGRARPLRALAARGPPASPFARRLCAFARRSRPRRFGPLACAAPVCARAALPWSPGRSFTPARLAEADFRAGFAFLPPRRAFRLAI